MLIQKLYDVVPRDDDRGRILTHSKILYRLMKNDNDEITHGWCYIGSHNFSPVSAFYVYILYQYIIS